MVMVMVMVMVVVLVVVLVVQKSKRPKKSNSGNVDSRESLVCCIPSIDVPKLELCLPSTAIVLELLERLHGPACKRSGCSCQLKFRKSFVETCLVVNWGATLVGGTSVYKFAFHIFALMIFSPDSKNEISICELGNFIFRTNDFLPDSKNQVSIWELGTLIDKQVLCIIHVYI